MQTTHIRAVPGGLPPGMGRTAAGRGTVQMPVECTCAEISAGSVKAAAGQGTVQRKRKKAEQLVTPSISYILMVGVNQCFNVL